MEMERVWKAMTIIGSVRLPQKELAGFRDEPDRSSQLESRLRPKSFLSGEPRVSVGPVSRILGRCSGAKFV
ncbi:MAG TPA: hypothetical protein DDX19_08505 [Rhodopirellula baltica]|uniref:Uncharacterized protein n=2 Tax=Rhodopirellula baltica TaxID=265606 RepID=F2ARC7_RHOBT|nr:hypothetical protein RBWH47_03685 [Rhodopirellula baltica WH47]ELP35814.1 hypothetical protein RBSWK_00221 [Rhodopirellula baltica SWK14]HBE62764.1 hypothetical protein [Rhodopirellula baltica]